MAVQLAVQGPCTAAGPFLLPKRRQECILTVCALCTKAEDLSLCLLNPGAKDKISTGAESLWASATGAQPSTYSSCVASEPAVCPVWWRKRAVLL